MRSLNTLGDAMKSNAMKLTDKQKRLLAELPDDRFVFPARFQERSYRKLESLGYATSEHLMAKRDVVAGITEFRPAFKRTPLGRETLSNKQDQ